MAAARTLSHDDYARAERLLGHNRARLVFGAKVKPVWSGERFWYLSSRRDGDRFVVVDLDAGTAEPAFDHDRLASALSVDALPFRSIELGEGSVSFDIGFEKRTCDLATYAVEAVEKPRPLPHELPSPDGRYAASVRDHNIWIRLLESGEEFALTQDGTSDVSYGTPPDAGSFAMTMAPFGMKLPPTAAWSPDSSRIVTHRLDQRELGHMHLVQSSPPGGGRPVLHSYRYAMPGESVGAGELLIGDVTSRTITPVKSAPFDIAYMSPFHQQRVWWSEDGDRLWWIDAERGDRCVRLNAIDPATGDVRAVVEEKSATHIDLHPLLVGRPNVRILASDEVIWFSQRDGWGHLYLYEGESCRQLTSGAWLVRDIVHVDEDQRAVYVIGLGREPGLDPYLRQLYRVGIDDGSIVRLSPEDLDHEITASPSGTYFVDTMSRVETPPSTVVRNASGEVVLTLDEADITDLLAAGWTWPQRFCVKAADGETDIWGTLYTPADVGTSNPVLDDTYPGPQINRAPATFFSGIWENGDQAPVFASLGFVVVTVDGRGTPMRSKAFHDASYGKLGDAGGLEDHIAAIRQLAATRPWMDLDRVGVYGSSGGGFASARAVMKYPDFYRVAVSAAGNHDQRFYHAMWGEKYQGLPDGDNYLEQVNASLAENLTGKLFLMHGEIDDNVHPHLTMQVVDALIRANKDFDLLIVPGAEHMLIGINAYVVRRRWDYFVRHLLGAEPPEGYRVADIPVSMEVFEAMFG